MKPRQSNLSPQFWTIFVFAFFCVLGLWLLHSGRPSDRPTAWLCIGLFGSMTLLTTLWEVGRHWQGPGVEWRLIKIEGIQRKVWFFPVSRLQQVLLLVTLFMMSAVCGGSAAFANPSLRTWEAAIVGSLALIVALGTAFSALAKTRGIALLPSGVLWLKDGVPLHVPWDAIETIATTRVAQDVGHGIKTQVTALGLRFNAAFLGQISEVPHTGRRALQPRTRSKLSSSRKECGFELTYLEEALVIPIGEAARLLNFFLENHRHRRELHPEETQLGFLETLLRSDNI